MSKTMSFGLSLVGFGPERQKCREALCMRRFRAHFGIGPRAIKAMMADMKRYEPNKPIDKTYLFMAMAWLKLYETEEVMAGRWGYGEQHCRETVREYVSRIRALKNAKISFDGLSRYCEFLPVDTVHVESQEFR